MKIGELTLDEYISLLDNLHKRILEIALEIKRLCEEHDIKYFLIGGSLLGAVRHQGFIPWDDDMDIGFLREDYQKFLGVCRQELSDKFTLVTTDEPKYGLPYGKIMLKNTVFLENGAPVLDCGNCVFVDIFPIDRLPDSNLQRRFHASLINLFKFVLLNKCNYPILKTQEMTATGYLISVFSHFLSKAFIVANLNRLLMLYNCRQSNYYYNSGSAYAYGKEIFPACSLEGDVAYLQFCGHSFPCPNNYEKVLELLYGDYMQLPPEDKRYNRHGVVEIDLGE